MLKQERTGFGTSNIGVRFNRNEHTAPKGYIVGKEVVEAVREYVRSWMPSGCHRGPDHDERPWSWGQVDRQTGGVWSIMAAPPLLRLSSARQLGGGGETGGPHRLGGGKP